MSVAETPLRQPLVITVIGAAGGCDSKSEAAPAPTVSMILKGFTLHSAGQSLRIMEVPSVGRLLRRDHQARN
jgi:hypothetical protein